MPVNVLDRLSINLWLSVRSYRWHRGAGAIARYPIRRRSGETCLEIREHHCPLGVRMAGADWGVQVDRPQSDSPRVWRAFGRLGIRVPQQDRNRIAHSILG